MPQDMVDRAVAAVPLPTAHHQKIDAHSLHQGLVQLIFHIAVQGNPSGEIVDLVERPGLQATHGHFNL